MFKDDDLKLGDIADRTLWDADSFDLTVTSPPYNVDMPYASVADDMPYEEYLEFCRLWMGNLLYWTKPHGRFCLNIPMHSNKFLKRATATDFINLAKDVGWRYETIIIWNKNHVASRTAWGSWMSASAPCVIPPVEVIIVFSKGEWKKPNKGETTIEKQEFIDWVLGMWSFAGESAKRMNHPAPFPPELPRRCIRLFSYKSDVIFDPFAGSGTTLMQAIKEGRQARGIEIDENYRNAALKRINNIAGELKQIEKNKKIFNIYG